jgi:hypothetical protein
VGGLRLGPPARSERGITEAPFKELEIDEAFEDLAAVLARRPPQPDARAARRRTANSAAALIGRALSA